MGTFLNSFFANRSLFFDLFDKAAQNLVNMAKLLVSEVHSNMATDDCAQIVKQVDRMEHTGDDITHKIYLSLDKIVFTPLNRNDIHALASTLDDVADTIKEASGRMYLYNIGDVDTPIKEIAEIILNASIDIEKAVHLLRNSKGSDAVLKICRQIKNYERQSDKVYYNAIADLFSNEKNPIRLIKYREILLALETSVNKCKCVTDALNGILINM